MQLDAVVRGGIGRQSRRREYPINDVYRVTRECVVTDECVVRTTNWGSAMLKADKIFNARIGNEARVKHTATNERTGAVHSKIDDPNAYEPKDK